MNRIDPGSVVGSGRGYHTDMIGALELCLHRTNDIFSEDEENRMKEAIHALGIDLLEEIERRYEEEPKRFRVRINQTKIMDVTARDMSDANKKALDNIIQHESIIGCPEIVRTEEI